MVGLGPAPHDFVSLPRHPDVSTKRSGQQNGNPLRTGISREMCLFSRHGRNHTAAPPAWLEALAVSEAQLAAGTVCPAEPIMQRLCQSIARLEARQAGECGRAVAPRR